MIQEYKYINGKIAAYDATEGLKEYDYQDNIKELLEQENVVEEMDKIIKELYDEKNYFIKHKKDFKNMLFNEKYGVKAAILFFLGLLISIYAYGSLGNYALLSAVLPGFTLSSALMLIYQNKKYKKDMLLGLSNVNEQIKEFEKIFEREKNKLNKMKNKKTIENVKNLDNDIVKINNESIQTIKNIELRKRYYENLRENLHKTEKNKKKKELYSMFGDSYKDQDISYIEDIMDDNKVLIKK